MPKKKYPDPFLFRPIHPEKYIGNTGQIVMRSKLELKFAMWCDRNPAIVKWGSEELVIPYQSPKDSKVHRYFVDFWMMTQRQDGTTERWLVEIKPLEQTVPPVAPKRQTDRSKVALMEATLTYYINQAKWRAADDYARKHNSKFIVITDKDLSNE